MSVVSGEEMSDDMQSLQAVANSVNNMATEIARLTKVREEEQSRVLASHGEALSDIKITLARIDERTGAFAEDLKRLEKADESQQVELDDHGSQLGTVKGVGTGIAFLLGAWEAIRSWVLK
jgi:hypothetical protein